MREPIAFARRQFAQACRYVRNDIGFYAASVAILAVPAICADLLLTEQDARAITLPLNVITLYLQITITFRALHSAGRAPVGYHPRMMANGRFPSAFAAGFISGFALLAGFILFVVPGVLLFILWSLWQPALAAEGLSASKSLRRSWQIARRAMLPLATVGLAFVVVATILVLFVAASVLVTPESGVATIAVTNVGLFALLIFSPTVWAFAYLELLGDAAEGRDHPLDDVSA